MYSRRLGCWFLQVQSKFILLHLCANTIFNASFFNTKSFCDWIKLLKKYCQFFQIAKLSHNCLFLLGTRLLSVITLLFYWHEAWIKTTTLFYNGEIFPSIQPPLLSKCIPKLRKTNCAINSCFEWLQCHRMFSCVHFFDQRPSPARRESKVSFTSHMSDLFFQRFLAKY